MQLLRQPRYALLAAAACLLGLAFTGVLAYLVPAAHTRDTVTLEQFKGLNRPAVTDFLLHVAHLANPVPYALIGFSLAGVALVRRRPRVAAAIVFLLFATGITTATLKHGLAYPRFSEWLGSAQISAASWPSGHATASMTLAFCAILAAPPALRPTAAAVGALFAISVSYAILALAWHFPSDVVGGFLVATTWTLLVVAVLGALPERRRAPRAAALGRPREAATQFGPHVVAFAAGSTVVAAWLARPEGATSFALARPSFVVAALGIAALATALAAGVARSAGD